MWDTIKTVLTSSNAIAVIIGIIIVLIILGFFGKSGLIRLNTDKISIGASDKERAIIRQQVEWTELAVRGFERQVPEYDGYNKYKTRWILERLYDEIITWIMFNHIEDTKNYITIKQDKIWNLVQSLVDEPIYTTDEFRDSIFSYVEIIIKKLVVIRKEYQ